MQTKKVKPINSIRQLSRLRHYRYGVRVKQQNAAELKVHVLLTSLYASSQHGQWNFQHTLNTKKCLKKGMPYFGISAFISWCMDGLIKPSSMHRSCNELGASYSESTSHSLSSFVLTVRIPSSTVFIGPHGDYWSLDKSTVDIPVHRMLL